MSGRCECIVEENLVIVEGTNGLLHVPHSPLVITFAHIETVISKLRQRDYAIRRERSVTRKQDVQ